MPWLNQPRKMNGFPAEQTPNKNKPNTSITRPVETHSRASLQAVRLYVQPPVRPYVSTTSRIHHSPANQNPFRHSSPVLNRPWIPKLMIISTNIVWIFQNTTATIIFFNPIITTALFGINRNITVSENTYLIIRRNGWRIILIRWITVILGYNKCHVWIKPGIWLVFRQNKRQK